MPPRDAQKRTVLRSPAQPKQYAARLDERRAGRRAKASPARGRVTFSTRWQSVEPDSNRHSIGGTCTCNQCARTHARTHARMRAGTDARTHAHTHVGMPVHAHARTHTALQADWRIGRMHGERGMVWLIVRLVRALRPGDETRGAGVRADASATTAESTGQYLEVLVMVVINLHGAKGTRS